MFNYLIGQWWFQWLLMIGAFFTGIVVLILALATLKGTVDWLGLSNNTEELKERRQRLDDIDKKINSLLPHHKDSK